MTNANAKSNKATTFNPAWYVFTAYNTEARFCWFDDRQDAGAYLDLIDKDGTKGFEFRGLTESEIELYGGNDKLDARCVMTSEQLKDIDDAGKDDARCVMTSEQPSDDDEEDEKDEDGAWYVVYTTNHERRYCWFTDSDDADTYCNYLNNKDEDCGACYEQLSKEEIKDIGRFRLQDTCVMTSDWLCKLDFDENAE